MSEFLIHIDAAKREIMAADSLVKIKTLWNKADAMRALGQAAKDPELVNCATEFKLRCERRLGEMLIQMKERGEISEGRNSRAPTRVKIPNLDISYDISARAQRIASVPEEKFEAAIAAVRQEEQQITRRAIKTLIEEAEKKLAQQTEVVTCEVSDLQGLAASGKKFGTIYADPPWEYDNRATRSAVNGVYRVDSITGKNTLTADEVAALPVAQLAAEQAHLHLWTTNAFLFDCKKIIEAWGFEYKSIFVWVKPQMGIGNYWRVSHELLLLGVRGGLTFQDRGLMSWLASDRGEHSAKPDKVRMLIERASPGPRLELFARRFSEGWASWGNEIERDIFSTGVAAL